MNLMASWQPSPAPKSVGSFHAGADPGFLDRGFKLAEGVRFVQFDHFVSEMPHENEII